MVLSICACLISIHALREEGDKMYRDSYNLHIMISIHALREEGDERHLYPPCNQHISIHALREEGDLLGDSGMGARFQFLSTPSARRATRRLPPAPVRQTDFYPHPPRGGRLLSSTSTATGS